jgi:uncharacterized membrane protein
MSPGRPTALLGTCVIASLTVASANLVVPQWVRVVFGVLIVFILPGFTVVCAALPARELSRAEELLAALAVSFVTSICVAVFLGATPIGLSRTSFAVVLGGITVVMSICAWFRARPWRDKQRRIENGPHHIRH